ncbi:hypothetical protein L596_026754 [Steinernema carpocapsae]|uniref:Uncharacterized protein n=1 Tax=Steinernema carpocapsae TaxID=34508 RepID=A0A4V5ZY96_STECR|nr:hypothetical protein L596_026754 [Steinernema carpocapsae]
MNPKVVVILCFLFLSAVMGQFFPGGFPGGYPGFYPGPFPGVANAPGDVYAHALPNAGLSGQVGIGVGNRASKNEVRPGQEGIFAKILKGVL